MRLSFFLFCVFFLALRADANDAPDARASLTGAASGAGGDASASHTAPPTSSAADGSPPGGAEKSPEHEEGSEHDGTERRTLSSGSGRTFKEDEEKELLDTIAEGEVYLKEMVYVLTVRGQGFGTDPERVAVRVNGVQVTQTVLHNENAVSFVIPDVLIDDEQVRDSSSVEIDVGGESVVKPVPMSALANAVKRMTLADFMDSAEDPPKMRSEEGSVAPSDETSETEHGGGSAEQVEESRDMVKPSEEHPAPDSPSDAGSGPEPQETNDAPAAPESNEVEDEQPKQEDASSEGSTSEEERQWAVSLREAVREHSARGSDESAAKVRALLDKGVEEEWPRAWHHLAVLLLVGDTHGFPRDFDTAVNLLEQASDAGLADAQAMMGLLHASGIAEPLVEKNTGTAILLWTVAAEAGSNYAKTALAYRYYSGVDVPEDCEKAAVYYEQTGRDIVYASRRRSRGEGSDEDKGGLGQIRPPTPRAIQTADRKRLEENMEPRARGEDNEVIQYYKHSAEHGDTQAQITMGKVYYYGGANMPQDTTRARSLFERAARNGRADAYSHLGFMDLHAGKNASAVAHLRKAAAKGDKLGLHGMGFVTLHGMGVERDELKAADYFLKAAEKEHPEAMFNLGLMYEKGVGVDASPEQAFRFFQEAARFGHLESSFNVGMMRLLGTPPARRECNVAVTKYLKDVSEQGPWNGVLSKALRSYEKGDYGNALFRYVQAAHVGIELAQYNAAFMLEHGKIFNRDATLPGMGLNIGFGARAPDNKEMARDSDSSETGRVRRKGGGKEWTRATAIADALDLYQMSSGQGYSPSMVRLGDLVYGEGKDFLRATHAYEKAARMRNAEAAFNLGWMHAVGYVSKPDPNLAKRYFDQAKEMDTQALIPATIAVFLLRYHSMALELVERWPNWRSALTRFGGMSDDGEIVVGDIFSSNAGSLLNKALEQYADVALLTFLFGVLGIIVNARQRRLVQAEEDEEGDVLLEGAEGDVDGDE